MARRDLKWKKCRKYVSYLVVVAGKVPVGGVGGGVEGCSGAGVGAGVGSGVGGGGLLVHQVPLQLPVQRSLLTLHQSPPCGTPLHPL